MKTFNQWMNEQIQNGNGTIKRYVSFNPKDVPHPIIVADHVWNECAKTHVLRLDQFLTQMRLLMKTDVRATSMINVFKEEMVKSMIANSVGFIPDEDIHPILGKGANRVTIDDPLNDEDQQSVFTPEGKEAIKNVFKII